MTTRHGLDAYLSADQTGGAVQGQARQVINQWRFVPARVAVGTGAGLCAVIAAIFAAMTTIDSHRVWAVLATLGYLAAFATCCRATGSAVTALRVAGIGAALLPAAALIGAGIRQAGGLCRRTLGQGPAEHRLALPHLDHRAGRRQPLPARHGRLRVTAPAARRFPAG